MSETTSILNQFAKKWLQKKSEIEHYAKYKGEKTPSLFADDEKPSWITVGAVDHHGGHPVQIEKKTGKMITGHFAGMTLAEAFGPVGKKQVADHMKPDYDTKLETLKERRDPDGIESNEKLPLFDKEAKGKEAASQEVDEDGFWIPTAEETANHRKKAIAKGLESVKKIPHLTSGKQAEFNALDPWMRLPDEQRKPFKDHIEYAKEIGKAFDADRAANAKAVAPGSMKDAPGIVMPSTTIPNEQAEAGDQLGLFGDAVKAKAPVFKPKLLDQPKQRGLFDTKGNPDQMDLFGDGVMPDDLVYKPHVKQEKQSVFSMSPDELAAHIESQPVNGFSTTRTEDWGNNRGQGKRMGGMVRGAMSDAPKGVKTYIDRFGKLPREEQEEANSLDGGAQNEYARARNAGLSHDDAMTWTYEKNGEVEAGFTHTRMQEAKAALKQPAKPEEPKVPQKAPSTSVKVGEFRNGIDRVGDVLRSVISAPNQSDRGKEMERLRRVVDEVKGLSSSRASESDLSQHANIIKRAQELLEKHDRGEGGQSLPIDEADQLKRARENPVQLDPKVKALFKPKPQTTDSPSENAFEAADAAEANGATPRQAAKAAQAHLDKDYEYARASEVGNAGEDLKGSARHKVNAWKGLAQAEADGTAEKLVNREGLHRLEPHDLMTHADKNPLSSLAMHYALRNFPPAPAGETKTHSAEKNREQYLNAYRSVKDKANELAESTPDHAVGAAVSQLRDFVSNKLREFRMQTDGASAFTAKDKYNPTANLLVKTYNALSSSTYKNKTGVMGRLEEFSKEANDKYDNALKSGKSWNLDEKKDFMSKLANHAKDVIEGQSLNKSFGKETEKRDVKRFDPSEAYVKIATRKGGRDVSKITADPVKAVDHMVKQMGMRGVQWGNSVTDDERKHHAGKALEAITDLADVTGLHPKDIALDGNLGLAIGARGKGLASAHYEPGSKVINLTRANGVGTLAHEWGHAFDHMLNGFGLETTNKGDKIVKRGGYMSNDTDTHEIVRRYGKNKELEYRSTTSEPEKMKDIEVEIKPRERSDIRDAYRGLNKVSEGFRDRLSRVLQDDVNSGKLSSKKANDYWNSDHEIFARSFEQYVMHKMKDKGIENTYLSGMSKGHKYWPTPEESKAMAPAFDKIFEHYRKEKHGSSEPIKYSRRESLHFFETIVRSCEASPEQFDNVYCYSGLRNEQTDWDLTYKPGIERYDWNSSKHPRDKAGRFTKVRDVVDRPQLQAHHSLHVGNQDTQTQLMISDYSKAFKGLLRNAGRKSEMNGMSQSDEDVWHHVDKEALQKLLKEVNAKDAVLRASSGPELDKLFNYNGTIPKTIAERLSGGSRFFDPTKLRGQWNESVPAIPEKKSPGTNPLPSVETIASQSTPTLPAQKDFPHDGLSTRKRNQVTKAISDLVSDNPEVIEEFRPILIDAWKQKVQEVNDHNQAIRQITGTRNPQAMSALIRGARNKTLDPAEKKNFDIMVDGAANGPFGHLLHGRGEDGLLDLLRTGVRLQPDILDDDVAQLAVSMAGPNFFQGFDKGTAPSEWDAVPFSSDGVREYYRVHFVEPVNLETYSQNHAARSFAITSTRPWLGLLA